MPAADASTSVAMLRRFISAVGRTSRETKRRGLSCPRLVVGDGHLGIWGALRNVYPQAAEQRCWNHKIVNVLAKLPKRQQDQAKLMLQYYPLRADSDGG